MNYSLDFVGGTSTNVTFDKEYTAEGIAEKLGIARVTVRKYLDYMEKEEKLEKNIEYGKVGRPQYKYYRVEDKK